MLVFYVIFENIFIDFVFWIYETSDYRLYEGNSEFSFTSMHPVMIWDIFQLLVIFRNDNMDKSQSQGQK